MADDRLYSIEESLWRDWSTTGWFPPVRVGLVHVCNRVSQCHRRHAALPGDGRAKWASGDLGRAAMAECDVDVPVQWAWMG